MPSPKDAPPTTPLPTRLINDPYSTPTQPSPNVSTPSAPPRTTSREEMISKYGPNIFEGIYDQEEAEPAQQNLSVDDGLDGEPQTRDAWDHVRTMTEGDNPIAKFYPEKEQVELTPEYIYGQIGMTDPRLSSGYQANPEAFEQEVIKYDLKRQALWKNLIGQTAQNAGIQKVPDWQEMSFGEDLLNSPKIAVMALSDGLRQMQSGNLDMAIGAMEAILPEDKEWVLAPMRWARHQIVDKVEAERRATEKAEMEAGEEGWANTSTSSSFSPTSPSWWTYHVAKNLAQIWSVKTAVGGLQSAKARLTGQMVMMGNMVGGGAYTDAKQTHLDNGLTEEQAERGAIAEAGVVALGSTALNYLPFGMNSSNSAISKGVVTQIKQLRQGAQQFGAKVAVSGFAEAVQEGGDESLEMGVQWLFRPDSDPFNGASERILTAMMTAGVAGTSGARGIDTSDIDPDFLHKAQVETALSTQEAIGEVMAKAFKVAPELMADYTALTQPDPELSKEENDQNARDAMSGLMQDTRFYEVAKALGLEQQSGFEEEVAQLAEETHSEEGAGVADLIKKFKEENPDRKVKLDMVEDESFQDKIDSGKMTVEQARRKAIDAGQSPDVDMSTMRVNGQNEVVIDEAGEFTDIIRLTKGHTDLTTVIEEYAEAYFARRLENDTAWKSTIGKARLAYEKATGEVSAKSDNEWWSDRAIEHSLGGKKSDGGWGKTFRRALGYISQYAQRMDKQAKQFRKLSDDGVFDEAFLQELDRAVAGSADNRTSTGESRVGLRGLDEALADPDNLNRQKKAKGLKKISYKDAKMTVDLDRGQVYSLDENGKAVQLKTVAEVQAHDGDLYTGEPSGSQIAGSISSEEADKTEISYKDAKMKITLGRGPVYEIDSEGNMAEVKSLEDLAESDGPFYTVFKPEPTKPKKKKAETKAEPKAKPAPKNFKHKSDHKPIRAKKARVSTNMNALKVLHLIETSNREPTQEELNALAKWTGWEGLGGVFDDDMADAYAGIPSHIKRRLDKGEVFPELVDVINWNKAFGRAHRLVKTFPEIQNSRRSEASDVSASGIKNFWALVEKGDFDGGNLLIPAGGVGTIIGTMPSKYDGKVTFTVIEANEVNARILRQLYPEATIDSTPYRYSEHRDGSFDAVIGDIPPDVATDVTLEAVANSKDSLATISKKKLDEKITELFGGKNQEFHVSGTKVISQRHGDMVLEVSEVAMRQPKGSAKRLTYRIDIKPHGAIGESPVLSRMVDIGESIESDLDRIKALADQVLDARKPEPTMDLEALRAMRRKLDRAYRIKDWEVVDALEPILDDAMAILDSQTDPEIETDSNPNVDALISEYSSYLNYKAGDGRSKKKWEGVDVAQHFLEKIKTLNNGKLNKGVTKAKVMQSMEDLHQAQQDMDARRDTGVNFQAELRPPRIIKTEDISPDDVEDLHVRDAKLNLEKGIPVYTVHEQDPDDLVLIENLEHLENVSEYFSVDTSGALSKQDAEYLDAVENDPDKAQAMVDQVAQEAGYGERTMHATPYSFTEFKRSAIPHTDPDTNIRGFHLSNEAGATSAYNGGSYNNSVRKDLEVGESKVLDLYVSMGRTVSRQKAQLAVYEGDDVDGFPKGYDTVVFHDPIVWTADIQKEFDETGVLKKNKFTEFRDDGAGGVDLWSSTAGGVVTGYESLKEALALQEGRHIVVRNPSQIKSAEAITRDDNGNIIPLSKRFNEDSNNINFQVEQRDATTRRNHSAHALNSGNKIERKVSKKAKYSPAEKKVLAQAKKALSAKIYERYAKNIDEHKKKHPTAGRDGWQEAELSKFEVEIDKETGEPKLDKNKQPKITVEYKTIPYGFNKAPNDSGNMVAMKKGSKEYNRAVKKLKKKGFREVELILDRSLAGDENATKIIEQAHWYAEMRQRLRSEFGGLGDMFADLLGALSPNTPVRGNFASALDVMRRMTRGDFDEALPVWVEKFDKIDDLEAQLMDMFAKKMQEGKVSKETGEVLPYSRQTQYHNLTKTVDGAIKLNKESSKKFYEAGGRSEGDVISANKDAIKNDPEYKAIRDQIAVEKKWIRDNSPIKENSITEDAPKGKKYGFNGPNAMRAMVGLWRRVQAENTDIGRGATAPKAVTFSGNLIGYTRGATIDVWAGRFLQRLSGQKRIPSASEGAVDGAILEDMSTTGAFGFGQDVFAGIAKDIRNSEKLSKHDKLQNIGDDDLQALVWFIEKEVWATNGWTNVAGEDGSFEQEMNFAGSSYQEAIKDLRKIIDGGLTKQKIKDEAKLLGITYDEAKAPAQTRLDEVKRVATETLDKFHRSVDRFFMGVSLERNEMFQGEEKRYRPTNEEMAEVGKDLHDTAYANDPTNEIMGIKTASSAGLYGALERAFDFELVTRENYDIRGLRRKMIEIAMEAKQDSVFLARRLRDEVRKKTFDPLVHRRGVEVYFKDGISMKDMRPIIKQLEGAGMKDGFTLIMDGLRSEGSVAMKHQKVVGVRALVLPEMDQRFGTEHQAMDDAQLLEMSDQSYRKMVKTVKKLYDIENVSNASIHEYDVEVIFREEYQEKLDEDDTVRSETGKSKDSDGGAWAGRTLREGLASASRGSEEGPVEAKRAEGSSDPEVSRVESGLGSNAPDVGVNFQAERREHKSSKRYAEDDSLHPEIRKAFADRTYMPMSNDVSDQMAEELLDLWADEADHHIKTETNGLHPALRVTMGHKLIRRHSENGENLRALEVGGALIIFGMRMGQGIQAFRVWSYYTPAGILRGAQQAIQEAGESILQVQAGVKEAVDVINAHTALHAKTVMKSEGSKVARKKAKKAQKKSDSSMVDRLAKLLGVTKGSLDRKAKLSKMEVLIKSSLEAFDSIPKLNKDGSEKRGPDTGVNFQAVAVLNDELSEKMTLAGTGLIAQGFSSYGAWRAEMTNRLGEGYDAHLYTIWSKSGNLYAQFVTKYATQKVVKDNLGLSLDQLVESHYSVQEEEKRSLYKKIVDELNIDPETARELSDAIETEMDNLSTEAKRKAIKKMLKGSTVAKTRLQKQLHMKLISSSNLGIISEESAKETLAKMAKVPSWNDALQKDIEDLAQQIQTAPVGSPKDKLIVKLHDRIADEMMKGKPLLMNKEVMVSLWYGNILSGYQTHERNIMGTFFQATNEAFYFLAQNPTQIARFHTALMRNLPLAFQSGWDIFRTGLYPIDTKNKYESSPSLENYDFKGKYNPLHLWKYVMRSMVGEDMVFRKSIMEAHSHAVAGIAGRKKNLRGEALDSYVAEAMGNDPMSDQEARTQAEMEGFEGRAYDMRVNEIKVLGREESITSNAEMFASRATFNYDPEHLIGSIAKSLGNHAQDYPALKMVIPFTRIVANVTNMSLDMTPWGYIRAVGGTKAVTDGKRTSFTREEQITQYAKATMGTIAMMMLALMDDDDDEEGFKVYGYGPADRHARELWKADGGKPYSIRVGGKHITYMYTPMAIPFSIVGSMKDAQRGKIFSDEEIYTKVAFAVSLFGGVILEQSFLSGVQDVAEMTTVRSAKDGQATSAMERFVSRQVQGALVPNAVKSVAQIFDPTVYKADDILGMMTAGIPVVGGWNNEAMLNIWGEPVERNTAFPSVGVLFGKDSTFVSKQSLDPVTRFVAKLNHEMGKGVVKVPSKQSHYRNPETRESEKMTPEVYRRYYKISQQRTKAELTRALPSLENMSTEHAVEVIARIQKNAKKRAKKAVERH